MARGGRRVAQGEPAGKLSPTAMLYRRLADLVVLLHFGFVLFVVLGGLLALRRPRLAWVQLPCAAWGVLIEYVGWVCPLTPLENLLRRRGGEATYRGGFVEHYIAGVLYPAGLGRTGPILLGTLVLVVNLAIYARLAAILISRRRARAPGG